MPNQKRPGVGVSVVVSRKQDALLVLRSRPPLEGLWAFPGGHVEWGETLAEAAAREVHEETGLSCSILGQVATFDAMTWPQAPDRADNIATIDAKSTTPILPESHHVLVVLAGQVSDQKPVAASDATDARFIDPTTLAPEACVPRLHDLFEKAMRLYFTSPPMDLTSSKDL